MANTLITPTWVMREVGRRLTNNLKFAANINRSYSDEFVQSGAKVGYTVNARLPQRYRVNKGQALNLQAVTDQIVPITLTDQANVGIEFSMASLTMEVQDYKKRYIDPAVDALVNTCDYDGLQRSYQSVYWAVGKPGEIPGSTGTLPGAANLPYLQATVKLRNIGVPEDGLVAMLNPEMHAYLAQANVTLFNPAGQISEYFRSGQFGRQALGIGEWYSTQNIPLHRTGNMGGTPVVASVPADGATSISTSGWTASAANVLRKGDVIQIAGVFAINPLNYQSTGQLQDFVVLNDVSADGSGNATISISPAIQVEGPFQNVSNLPAASAAITQFGHASNYANKNSPQALVFQPDAFAMVMADLELPQGMWVAERISNKALGISIRFLKDYSILTDQSPARLDILYGFKTVRPEMACRVCG